MSFLNGIKNPYIFAFSGAPPLRHEFAAGQKNRASHASSIAAGATLVSRVKPLVRVSQIFPRIILSVVVDVIDNIFGKRASHVEKGKPVSVVLLVINRYLDVSVRPNAGSLARVSSIPRRDFGRVTPRGTCSFIPCENSCRRVIGENFLKSFLREHGNLLSSRTYHNPGVQA